MPDDDFDDDRPRRRRDDEDDDFDDRPRRRRRERPDYEEAHRGGLILALGIIGLLVCPLTGIFAWIMGNADMKAMDEDRMDPEGRQLTQVGKILGIVATGLLCLQLVILAIYAVVFIVFVGAAAAGGAGQPPQQPPPVKAPAPQFPPPGKGR